MQEQGGLHQRAEERADPLAGERGRSAAPRLGRSTSRRSARHCSKASGSWCAATRPSPRSGPANAQNCWPRPKRSLPRSRPASTVPAAGCAARRPVRSASGREDHQQIQGRQALHPHDHRRHVRLRAQDRADHSGGCAGRSLRDPDDPPRRSARRKRRVRAYNSSDGRARFATMKDTIEIRPIHHHLETRVRAHVFLCMLAYYVSFELHQRLPELLFTDDTPLAPTDPVKPATRSASAHTKAGSATTPDGYPAHTLPDLLADLGNDLPQHRPHRPPPSTPSPASPHPPRYKPTPSNCSTSNSTSSQSHTSPQHPNPRANTAGFVISRPKTSGSRPARESTRVGTPPLVQPTDPGSETAYVPGHLPASAARPLTPRRWLTSGRGRSATRTSRRSSRRTSRRSACA